MSQQESQAPRWLRGAQIAWVVVVTAALLMYAVGSVVYFSQLRQVCTATAVQCGGFDYATATGAAQLAAHGLSLDAYALLRVSIRIVYSLVPIILAILIFMRRRDEPIALLVSFFLVSFGTAGEANSVLAEAYPLLSTLEQFIEWLSITSLPLFFGLFPNGRMVPRLYWGVVAYFSIGYFVQATLGLVDINSPLGSFWSWTGWLSVLLGGVGAQVYRYRRVSTPVERQQTRWVLFGLGTMAVFLLSFLAYTAISGDNTMFSSTDLNLPRRLLFVAIQNSLFEVVFLSIGLAILRSKLFDIDIIIRKTLVYTVLSGLLALVYFGMVVLLQSVFNLVSGQQSAVAIVITTLVIAALFAPLRRRIQDVIDRRFYRKKYDAQQVLAQFAQTCRDETDMDRLTAELIHVIQETMQPKSVSVWLAREKKGGKVEG